MVFYHKLCRAPPTRRHIFSSKRSCRSLSLGHKRLKSFSTWRYKPAVFSLMGSHNYKIRRSFSVPFECHLLLLRPSCLGVRSQIEELQSGCFPGPLKEAIRRLLSLVINLLLPSFKFSGLRNVTLNSECWNLSNVWVEAKVVYRWIPCNSLYFTEECRSPDYNKHIVFAWEKNIKRFSNSFLTNSVHVGLRDLFRSNRLKALRVLQSRLLNVYKHFGWAMDCLFIE